MKPFIVNELAKQATWSETPVRLHHWRVSGGAEVDVVLERDDGQVVGVECKAKDTVTMGDFRGLIALRDLLDDQFSVGIVLHTGRHRSVSFVDRLLAMPIASLWEMGSS